MAKAIGKSTWKNLYYYVKYELKKNWEGYAIIAGGAFTGMLILILWIAYVNWEFNTKYGEFFK